MKTMIPKILRIWEKGQTSSYSNNFDNHGYKNYNDKRKRTDKTYNLLCEKIFPWIGTPKEEGRIAEAGGRKEKIKFHIYWWQFFYNNNPKKK